MFQPSLIECRNVNHALHFVHQFKATHNRHQMVGVLQRRVSLVSNDTGIGIELQRLVSRKQPIGQRSNAVHTRHYSKYFRSRVRSHSVIQLPAYASQSGPMRRRAGAEEGNLLRGSANRIGSSV